ncbi:MAG: efflux RND transporter periplasmic adaptor subunit, partial [Rhodobacteraceae bacterium]|nr:efflux RND transporter periplasmic adaptor subunit [Paracoccaceae bacterium]
MTDNLSGQTDPKGLEFETDAGSSRGFWGALSLTVLIVAWMGSGLFIDSPAPEPANTNIEIEPVAVA